MVASARAAAAPVQSSGVILARRPTRKDPHLPSRDEILAFVSAHPEKATDADRVYVAEMLERPSFRLLIGIDEEKKKAARAAS